MTSIPARRATEMCYTLAEGPVWDAGRERLLWVDIPAGIVHQGVLERDGSVTAVRELTFSDPVGAVAVAKFGTLAVAAGRRC